MLSDVTRLCGSERELTAKLVLYLSEIEERRLHLEAGFSSPFEFCVKELRLSEGEAFRRIVAARLGRRFPVIFALIASGAVHLSALELLRDRLTAENHRQLLEAVSGKSKREVEKLLAARFPKPDVPSRIRKLPESARVASGTSIGVLLERERGSTEVTPVVSEAGFALGGGQGSGQPMPRRARIQPPSESRFKVEFTASADLRDKLELARDLMSHANPSRALDMVVERAVDLLLAELERKRLAKVKRPRRPVTEPLSKPGRIGRAVRREVFERDGLRCTYVAPNGRRCAARAFLELDHAEPRAQGGADGAHNLRVRCRAHNLLWAEQSYGREHVERRRHLRQQKRSRERAGRERPGPATRGAATISAEQCDRLRQALTRMGFRDGEVGRAVREAAQKCASMDGSVPIEKLLRTALTLLDRRRDHSSAIRTQLKL